MSKRKRGNRKKQPGKRHRDRVKKAKREAEELQTSLQEETEDKASPNDAESEISEDEAHEPQSGQRFDEELRFLHDDERGVTWSPSPERRLRDADPQIEDDEREATSSPSPEPGSDDAESQVSDDEQDEGIAVQPTGELCIVICRLSSNKMEPKTSVLTTTESRREAHYERRRVEGRELARRLSANCPVPFTFRRVFATCHKRQATISTNWQAQHEPRSAMEKDIGGWFRGPNMRGKRVSVLIRGLDGVTCDVDSFSSFLEMIRLSGVHAQLIFQWNKIFPEIDPNCLRNFQGLGGTVDIMAADFHAHLEGTQNIPLVARMITIWRAVTTNKGNQEGLQDRNKLLQPTAMRPFNGGRAARIPHNW